METRLTRAVYDRAPIFLRSGASSLVGWAKNRRRMQGDYGRWKQLFEEASHWSEERLLEYQDGCLRAQVEAAYAHVPFWRSRFDEHGISPGSLRRGEDLRQLPILEKVDLVAAGESLINPRWDPKDLSRYPTSGSTGTPLEVIRPSGIEQMEWAFMHARWFPTDRVRPPYASFTGLELLPPSREKPPFWIDNWSNRQRMFSIFHMNERNLPHYVRALDRHESHFFIGYPSAIFTVADFMKRHDLRLQRNPRYILSASEELQPHYEERLDEVFGAEIRNRYGQNEFVGSITRYSCGHLHYDMDYSILEFMEVERRANGEILAEVIGTNMHDHAWPLLRYRTGDLIVYHPDDRCSQGRAGQIVRRIHGRTGRYFTLPNGSRVTNISVIAKKCSNIRFMQVVQRRLGAIEIRVVPDTGFSTADENRIVEEFRKKVGDAIELEITIVDDIERTRAGKYLSIVNEMT